MASRSYGAFYLKNFADRKLGRAADAVGEVVTRKNSQHCRCEYLSIPWGTAFHHNFSITLNSTLGTGRTGNVAVRIERSMARAYLCKGVLKLPAHDALGAFSIDVAALYFDFRTRPGVPHEKCQYPTKLKGSMHVAPVDQWAMPSDSIQPTLNGCLRRYYGICTRDYCRGVPSAASGTLTAHVRQGDLFGLNYERSPHPQMGQPPLSYYLAAMTFIKWKRIIVIGQPTQQMSPIWKSLKMLQSTGLLNLSFNTESSTSWHDDLRSLMCASSIVFGPSSIRQFLRLGWANRYFFYSCWFSSEIDARRYIIGLKQPYTPMKNHTNSPEEWVEMLLSEVVMPIMCNTSGSS